MHLFYLRTYILLRRYAKCSLTVNLQFLDPLVCILISSSFDKHKHVLLDDSM